MKFSQLKIGAVFAFDGVKYIKTSPMIGRCEDNGMQKFFRRSSEVDRNDTDLPSEQTGNIMQTEVAEAFADFYRHCELCLQSLTPALDERTLKHLHGKLESARRDFFARIN